MVAIDSDRVLLNMQRLTNGGLIPEAFGIKIAITLRYRPSYAACCSIDFLSSSLAAYKKSGDKETEI